MTMLRTLILTLVLLWSTLAPAALIASGWQYDVSLPALAERVTALEKEVHLRAKASEDAIRVASSTMEKRLDGMNEFRDTLRDQAGKFITKAEHDIIWAKVDEEIKVLMKAKSELEGKASQQSMLIVLAVALTSFVMGGLGLIMRALKF